MTTGLMCHVNHVEGDINTVGLPWSIPNVHCPSCPTVDIEKALIWYGESSRYLINSSSPTTAPRPTNSPPCLSQWIQNDFTAPQLKISLQSASATSVPLTYLDIVTPILVFIFQLFIFLAPNQRYISNHRPSIYPCKLYTNVLALCALPNKLTSVFHIPIEFTQK